MSAGTLTLTNNSAAVAGSGTEFTTEVAAGDFIVVTVGGVPYTLPIKSVESGTALTLVSNFTGPTQSGAAWSAVPRVALNMVTAALVAQSAEALRGLNYDKHNWQQVYSAAGSITVKLPDGTTFTGPSWKYLADNAAMKNDGAVPVTQGGTGATNAKKARENLGLDRVSQEAGETYLRSQNRDLVFMVQDSGNWGYYQSSSGQWKPLGRDQGGTGATDEQGARNNLGITALGLGSSYPLPSTGGAQLTGFYTIEGGSSQVPPMAAGTGCGVIHIDGHGYGLDIAGVLGGGARLFARTYNGNVGQIWREFYSNGNTTVDANGNLKPSSPIIKLKGDGTAELNDESAGVVVERIGTGAYKISGVLGFNADPVWGGANGGYVIPCNANGLPLLWVDYEIDPDGSITLKTYHRTHENAPTFARNHIESLQDGEPVDIPAGRWVDLRVEMPQDSIWYQKQKDTQDEMEKAERECQQDTQL